MKKVILNLPHTLSPSIHSEAYICWLYLVSIVSPCRLILLFTKNQLYYVIKAIKPMASDIIKKKIWT